MKTVLVVEDDAHVRRILRTLLEGEGYRVVEAENGLQGLSAAAADPPDCLLTDTMMPHLDGMALLRQLRAGGRTVPTLVVSAAATLPPLQELKEYGVVGIIAKPFDFDALLEAVRAICKP
jgi:CheY-like chemotaxis protein